MARRKYRWCAVPQCTNTSTTSNKLFFDVPRKANVRNKWLKLAKLKCEGMSETSPIYFCEDHFDLPNDMENYMRYHIMGHVDKVMLKPGRFPSRFLCQIIPKTAEKSHSDAVRTNFPLVCRVCFDKDSKLQHMHDNMKMYTGYEDVTGLLLSDEQDLPPYLCTSCADQLMTCARFRHRSLQAHLMLLDILRNHGHISLELIQASINVQQDNVTDIEHRKKRRKSMEDQNCKDGNIMVLELKNESMDYESEDVSIDRRERESNVNIGNIIKSLKKEMEDVIECEDVAIDYKPEIEVINIEYDDSTDIKKDIVDEKDSEDAIDDNRTVFIEIDTSSQHSVDEIKTEFIDVNLECDVVKDNCQENDVHIDSDDSTLDDIRTKYINDKTESDTVDKSRKIIIDVNLDYVNGCGNSTLMNNGNEINNGLTANNTCGSINQCENNPYVMVKDIVKEDAFDKELVNDNVDDCELKTGKDALDDGRLGENEGTNSTEKDIDIKQKNTQYSDSDELINDESSELNSDEILSHITAKGNLHYCDKCDFKSRFKKVLMAHFVIHSDNKLYQCSFCKKEYSYKRSLINHLQLHSTEKSLKCGICKKDFCQRSAFFRHMRNHNDEPYSCDVCRQSDENCHCELTHIINRPFLCHICDRSFTRNFHFKNHMLIHSGEKPHKCEICGKCFRVKSKLKAHMGRHLTDRTCDGMKPRLGNESSLEEDKPFKCEVCKNSFRRKYHYQTHMLTHTDNKPYSCVVCSMRFRRNTHLNRHLLTHSVVC